MRKGKPSQLIDELEAKIDELRERSDVHSSEDVIDDGTDVIEAGENLDEPAFDEDDGWHSSFYLEDIKDLAEKSVNVSTIEDLEDVLDDLSGIDADLYEKAIELDDSGEYSPAYIGKMISDELYWKIKDAEGIKGACSGKKKIQADISIDNLDHDDVIDWLGEHETAYHDFKYHFDIDQDDDDSIYQIDTEAIVDWISEHDQLWEDFQNHFEIYEEEIKGACSGKKKIQADISIDNLDHDDVIDWLGEHETAYHDFKYHFDIDQDDDDSIYQIDTEAIVDWISEHDQLWEDFQNHFEIYEEEIEGACSGKKKVTSSEDRWLYTMCDECGYEGKVLESEYDACCPRCHDHTGGYGVVEDYEEEEEIEGACGKKSVTSAEEIEEENIEISEPAEEDHTEYLTGLYQSVEQELRDLAEGLSWSSDEDNIYMDVSFTDGHVFTFTIPKADLAYDIQNMGQDIEYICTAVRDTHSEPEEFEDLEIPEEDLSPEAVLEEYDIPAYM